MEMDSKLCFIWLLPFLLWIIISIVSKFYRQAWISLLSVGVASFLASMTIAAITAQGLPNRYSFWCLIASIVLLLGMIYPLIRDIQITKIKDKKDKMIIG